ncbi:hypothetical protein FB645_003150 [Coemansia sp. IMI 203386]|nr:hypothetical protein FB645_003150 [Coemansia sp. IMI 203386]
MVFLSAINSRPLSDYDSSKPTTTGEQIYRLAWKEPFEYEVKVYATTESYLKENKTRFFENAELLWHIPSQSLENRYPKFKKKITVNVPDTVLDDKAMSTSLYAHVFMQKAGQLSPYPNTTDPYLVYLKSELVWWVDPQVEREWTEEYSTGIPYKLMAATTLPWATVLENNRYRKTGLPSRINDQLYFRFSPLPAKGTYLPLLAINQYTKNPREFMPVAVMRSNETDSVSVNLSVDIQMEFQGISELMVTLKNEMLKFSDKDRYHINRQWQLSDLIVARGYKENPSTDSGNRHYRPLTVGEKNSVSVLIISSVFMVIYFISATYSVKLTARFWVGPRSNFFGVPRAMILLDVVDCLLRVLHTYIEGGSWLLDNALMLFGTFGTVAVVFNPFSDKETAGMSEIQNACTSKPEQDNTETTTNEKEQQQALIQPPEAAILSAEHVERLRVIDIRKTLDASILRWVWKLLVPGMVVVAAYSYRENDYQWDNQDFILTNIGSLVYLTTWSAWIPQIVLNHFAQSGSLIPVSILMLEAFEILLSYLVNKLIGGHEFFGYQGFNRMFKFICHVVMIAQWAWFVRKNKTQGK